MPEWQGYLFISWTFEKENTQKRHINIPSTPGIAALAQAKALGYRNFQGVSRPIDSHKGCVSCHFRHVEITPLWGSRFCAYFLRAIQLQAFFFRPYTLLRIETKMWAGSPLLAIGFPFCQFSWQNASTRLTSLPPRHSVQCCAKVDGGKKSGQKEHVRDH